VLCNHVERLLTDAAGRAKYSYLSSFVHGNVENRAQSYEKTSEMQKENLFFFSFPNVSTFGEAKVTKKVVTNISFGKINANHFSETQR
jgi:hypothetical protein